SGEQVLVDVETKSNKEIMEHIKKILGKNEETLKEEEEEKKELSHPAYFGPRKYCLRECICEVEGQVPCPRLVPLPKEMTGKYKKPPSTVIVVTGKDGGKVSQSLSGQQRNLPFSFINTALARQQDSAHPEQAHSSDRTAETKALVKGALGMKTPEKGTPALQGGHTPPAQHAASPDCTQELLSGSNVHLALSGRKALPAVNGRGDGDVCSCCKDCSESSASGESPGLEEPAVPTTDHDKHQLSG
ncbi:hypothetical protein MC885_012776, partial [Smutsia gigantea]